MLVSISQRRYYNKIDNMDVIEELEIFNKEIQEARRVVSALNSKRINWCQDNRRQIKKLYPIKDKIYQLIDIKKSVSSWYYENLCDDIYFFRPKNISFRPSNDFHTCNGDERPTVKGEILDSDLNQIKYGSDVSVYITDIKKVEKPKKLHSKFTKVYVMIDKNTGYYKIGRSVNPERREKTLQSEKPTIEMLFNHDARVKDEKELHDMFKDKRIRGEWFDLNGSDLTKIREFFNCNE